MKVIMKIILEKDEFEDLKSKYNDLEMLQCKQLYDLHKRNGIYNELEVDPEIMKRVDEYFTDTFGSEFGSVSERLDTMLADENDPNAFIIRKSVSDFIRHVETYLKMCPY